MSKDPTNCVMCGKTAIDPDEGRVVDFVDGEPWCEECYTEHYMGTCFRCQEIVDNSELGEGVGDIVAVHRGLSGNETSGGELPSGYYRILEVPFVVSCIIGGHVRSGCLKRVSDLDDEGKRAAEYLLGVEMGPLCRECREAVGSSLALSEKEGRG